MKITVESLQSYTLGAASTLLITFITQLIIHFLGKNQAREERTESFKLKLTELRIQAAQTAYQYVLRVYRAYKSQPPKPYADTLNKEARDWLDGQALILGDKVYEPIIYYFFAMDDKTLSDQDHAKQLVKAETALKSVLKNISL